MPQFLKVHSVYMYKAEQNIRYGSGYMLKNIRVGRSAVFFVLFFVFFFQSPQSGNKSGFFTDTYTLYYCKLPFFMPKKKSKNKLILQWFNTCLNNLITSFFLHSQNKYLNWKCISFPKHFPSQLSMDWIKGKFTGKPHI